MRENNEYSTRIAEEQAKRARRNLSPTPAARVAMIMYGDEYAAQGGGTMDFWDQLDIKRQQRCQLTATALFKHFRAAR